jgi:hypothetical protein
LKQQHKKQANNAKKKAKWTLLILYGHVLSKSRASDRPDRADSRGVHTTRDTRRTSTRLPFAKVRRACQRWSLGTGALVNKARAAIRQRWIRRARGAHRHQHGAARRRTCGRCSALSVYLVALGASRARPDVADDVGAMCLRAAYNGTAVGMALFFVASYIRKTCRRMKFS